MPADDYPTMSLRVPVSTGGWAGGLVSKRDGARRPTGVGPPLPHLECPCAMPAAINSAVPGSTVTLMVTSCVSTPRTVPVALDSQSAG